ncbi:MAG: hypothetical protein RL711_961 [Bacteroidota bacterium]
MIFKQIYLILFFIVDNFLFLLKTLFINRLGKHEVKMVLFLQKV